MTFKANIPQLVAAEIADPGVAGSPPSIGWPYRRSEGLSL